MMIATTVSIRIGFNGVVVAVFSVTDWLSADEFVSVFV